MKVTRIVVMGQVEYKGLLELIEWVEAMPAIANVGDRFWDNITDTVADLLPSIPELAGDDFYYNTPFTKDGDLLLDLISTEGPGDIRICLTTK